jgi:hypothetical protein
MKIARRPHTVGNKKRYSIDYSDWLDAGISVSSATVTSDTADLTVSDKVISGNKVIFYLNGGSLNETATISVQMVNSRSEIKNDTIEVFTVAP